MIIDFAVGQDAVEKAGGVEIAQKIVTNELYGFAFAEDNDALREQVNAGAGGDQGGRHARASIYQKYFKKDPPKSVLEGTHEPE